MFTTALAALMFSALLGRAPAQPTTAQTHGGHHDPQKPATDMAMPSWTLMQDGAFTLMLDSQGGPRGDTEVRAPNWWMGMASREVGRGSFTAQLMLSLDAALVGKCGYGELFQVGETCNGRPLTDRQHPHDFLGQLAAVWTVPLTERASLILAGGPVGEPALGPVAFMHRPSAAGIAVAPLSHHTFDSTHIAMGVATAALDRAPFSIEASVFNGREPNENRWNPIDRGAWDSWSGRLWYRPTPEWQFQVSTGHLVQPEALEPGNIQRTTASAGWFRRREDGFLALAGGYGRNDKSHDTLNAVFAEGTRRFGPNGIYARFEALQVETDILASGVPPVDHHDLPLQTVVAVSGGGSRDLFSIAGLAIGVSADVTVYRVPPVLVATHGRRPVSFHVSLLVRPASLAGRMWNMTMTGLAMQRNHAGHSMPGM